MNIQRLKATNFRSYAKADVDFTKTDVAAVIGENGAGKSSFFAYAFCYALWGKVPGIQTVDLVKWNCTKMEVVLDFSHDDGCSYRLTRGATIANRKGKASASGHLSLVRFSDDGSKEDVSGNTIAVTTAKISEMLGGLTLETALHSNFCLQGDADRFMLAEPSQRRLLFERILNLEQYDALESAAKAKAKESASVIYTLDVDDRQEDSLKLEIEQATKTQAAKIKKRDGLQTSCDELIAGIGKLEAVIGDGTEAIEDRLLGLNDNINTTWDAIDKIQQQKETTAAILGKKKEIASGYKNLKEIEASFAKSQERKQQYLALTAKQETIESKIKSDEDQVKQLKTDIQGLLDQQIAETAKIRTKYSLPEELDIGSGLQGCLISQQDKVDALEADSAEMNVLIDESQKKQLAFARTATTKQAAVDSVRDTIKKIAEAGPLCPVLKKPCNLLSKENLDEEQAALREALRALENEVAGINKEAEAENKNEKRLRQGLAGITQRHAAAAAACKEIEMVLESYEKMIARDIVESIEKKKMLIGGLEKRVAENRVLFDGLKKQLGELAFDAKKFDEEAASLKEQQSQNWEKQYQSLLVAEEAMKGLDARLKETKARLAELNKKVAETTKELAAKRAEVAKAEPELKKMQDSLAVQRADMVGINDEINTLAKQIGTAQSALARTQERKNTVAAHRKSLVMYEGLAKAYQMAKALITENSIPKYQQFCNDILDYLGIAVRIRIETLEEVQDSKTKATKINRVFKIMVIDNNGDERDYQTWSGGEKHRINLALRHALSMTLLNRSGAKIGLVIIDEGDTKLDAAGKSSLLQLIEATSQGQFGYAAKVLFVTHSEDLKDRLPARFDVQKTKQGSVIAAG